MLLLIVFVVLVMTGGAGSVISCYITSLSGSLIITICHHPFIHPRMLGKINSMQDTIRFCCTEYKTGADPFI